MRVIIIESTVYKATEKQYKEIKAFEKEKFKNGYFPRIDLEISDFLDEYKMKLKLIGDIDFDFRL
jgi:hypothetical protein